MLTIENILGKHKYIKADLLIKAKELNISGYSKLSKDKLIEAILFTNNIPLSKTERKQSKIKSQPKKTIPKPLKNNVWNTYIGREKGIGECFTCHQEIDSKHFECGHVLAEKEGGDITVDNLRPVCSLCNKSMGTTNMNDFKDKLSKSSNIIIFTHFLQKYKFLLQQPTKTFINYSLNIHQQNYISNDKELIKKMNYESLLFENIKELWCNTDRINEFISLYQKDKNTIKDSIDYINKNNNTFNNKKDISYTEIHKDKLIRWLVDNNLIVIDVTNKKIEVKSKEQIIKENCRCKEPYMLYRSSSMHNNNGGILSMWNIPEYITCDTCGDEIKNPKYNSNNRRRVSMALY